MALIERNELCKVLFEEVKNLNPNSFVDFLIQKGLNLALIHTRMQPEAKQEQEHGHWEYAETIGGMKYYHCANCEKIEPGSECIADENQILWFNFCPKCGAKMKMNKTQNDNICFIDCENIAENTAIYNFNTKILKQGKTNLSQKQIKRIAFILATDLKNFAESNGDISNLTANAVYTHLQSNQ